MAAVGATGRTVFEKVHEQRKINYEINNDPGCGFRRRNPDDHRLQDGERQIRHGL
jgi:hypothetical protein